MMTFNWKQNFHGRTDLNIYGSNALLMYALQLKYGIEDIHSEAINCLLDGNDDKKIDLLYFDETRGEIVVAQSYFSLTTKKEAPANKASDLNTAVSWLLSRNINELPERLQSPAKELRQRITDLEVYNFSIWYSHNCEESDNVRDELKTAEETASSLIKAHFPGKHINVKSYEIGINILEDWYNGLTIPILVTDEFELKKVDGYNIKESDWESFVSYIPARKIYELYKDHGTNLFSANVRDYLGSRTSDSNINNGIKKTAKDKPENFFVYNNGITALVNDFEFSRRKKTLLIKGLSIVNGAQTSGAIGSLEVIPDQSLFIPIRFIKCNNPDTIVEIVKYNNSQNKINAPDFRSSDPIQKKLIREFEELNLLEYSSRRGGSADIIRRNSNVLPSVTAGQILAAFHDDPVIAYNEKSKIFESDKIYPRFFNEATTAKHIYFIYSLRKAIEKKKIELLDKDSLTLNEQKLNSYFKVRGSLVVLMTAVSKVMEELLDKPISNKFNLRFCKSLNLEDAISVWEPIINIVSSFSSQLQEGLTDGIKNVQKLEHGLITFNQLVSAVKVANQDTLDEFRKNVCM